MNLDILCGPSISNYLFIVFLLILAGALRRWYNPPWFSEQIPSTTYDPLLLRKAFEKVFSGPSFCAFISIVFLKFFTTIHLVRQNRKNGGGKGLSWGCNRMRMLLGWKRRVCLSIDASFILYVYVCLHFKSNKI